MPDVLTVGSLFAGIGGIDLGLERTGHFRTVWFCERDKFCQQVLAKHWPGVPCYDDVADIGADVSPVDVLTAGFPCQPVSLAGRRLAQDDERWLWPHVHRLIRLLRPRFVLLENVPGLLTAGFDDVIGDLAACGYDAEWDCIPAAALGAPHRRDRVFIVASQGELASVATGTRECAVEKSDCKRPVRLIVAEVAGEDGRGPNATPSRPDSERGWPSPMAYASGKGSQGHWRSVQLAKSGHAAAHGASRGAKDVADSAGVRLPRQGEPVHAIGPASGDDWEATRAVYGRISDQWRVEPGVGRVANGVPRRVDRLRSLGNAVVPQVAHFVGSVIADRAGIE